MKIKILNRGSRTINPNTPVAMPPGKWTEVEEDFGKKLLKMFPKDLTVSDTPPSEQTARIEALEKENAELKAEIAKLKPAPKVKAPAVKTPVADPLV